MVKNPVPCSLTQLCLTLCNPMDCNLPGSPAHGDSPGKNIGGGCHALLQGIFSTQRQNPGPPYCKWILYRLSPPGQPKILGWVVYSFSRGTSWLRNQTRVSCIAGGSYTSWATREARKIMGKDQKDMKAILKRLLPTNLEQLDH